MATGVRSCQLNGTPVASGVVNRLDRVMTTMCGLPRAPLASRKPSAPAPPALFTTTIGCRISPCLETMPWMTRAIWSAPPPVPAGTMNWTGRVGSQARWARAGAASAVAPRPSRRVRRVDPWSNIVVIPGNALRSWSGPTNVALAVALLPGWGGKRGKATKSV